MKYIITVVWLVSVAVLDLGAQQYSTVEELSQVTQISDRVYLSEDSPVGGRADLLGDGSILISKKDTSKSFWKTTSFNSSATWESKWIEQSADCITINWSTYGIEQDFSQGWKKFEGNPLIAGSEFHLKSERTLVLPEYSGGRPNDQSLVKGAGDYEDKWLLFFNIDGWAAKGWAAVVADSLAPLIRGINPFSILEPFPLTKATGGYNAPNDWIWVDSLWYAPDESRDHVSKMWSSSDLEYWTLHGPIDGINGHDPGMVWDGETFYLFNESNNDLTCVQSTDPLGKWTPCTGSDSLGVVLKLGDHTGDADVGFFNNRWHMFMDDGVHFKYRISYASTSAEDFPIGWKLQKEILGPHNPEQDQQWDDWGESGNNFGTGDADFTIENDYIYVTYERPTGIAYKKLECGDSGSIGLSMTLITENKKGKVKEKSYDLAKNNKVKMPKNTVRFRIVLDLKTMNPKLSPMVSGITLD